MNGVLGMARITKVILEDKVKELEEVIKKQSSQLIEVEIEKNLILEKKGYVSKKRYEKLEELFNFYKSSNEEQNKMYKFLNDELNLSKEKITKLNSELVQAYQEINDLKKNSDKLNSELKHNERGAGRKPKLTDKQRQQVIAMHKEGYSMGNIAKKFNISKGLVHKVIHS